MSTGASPWSADADLVVIGSGVAGLTLATAAVERGLRVLVVTKDEAGQGSTAWAQGGIAVVLAQDHDNGDSVQEHVRDTLTAGAGLCDERAVSAIIADAPEAVGWLRARGAEFDRAAGGGLARGREGGHSRFRVVHAGGDATGAEVERALLAASRDRRVSLLERHVAVELLRSEHGSVAGVLVLDDDGVPGVLTAPAVALATGGIGQLYQTTTNPPVATGDGLLLALRAGATVSDIEFVQFHPTALQAGGSRQGRRPLVTEAIRGEGAVLLDVTGDRVMAGVHPLADLAPRDVVAAALTRRMAETGSDHVLLDTPSLGAELLRGRFPTVYAACMAAGVDPAREPIPVAPAAHFFCGGVTSTTDGRTELPGLYAVGEVARSGLHGANRLASNSLLEGLVMGLRAAEAVSADLRDGQLRRHQLSGLPTLPAAAVADPATVRALMTRHAAIGRDAAGLLTARRALDQAATTRVLDSREALEAAALTVTARAVLTAALARCESRGCHVRTDAPGRDDTTWSRSITLRLAADGTPSVVRSHDLEGVAA